MFPKLYACIARSLPLLICALSAPFQVEACKFTSPSSATFTIGVENCFEITTDQGVFIDYLGDLPSGVLFEAIDDFPSKAFLRGIPARGSAGIYSLTFKTQCFNYYNCLDSCRLVSNENEFTKCMNNCYYNSKNNYFQDFTLYVVDPAAPSEPTNTSVTQQAVTAQAPLLTHVRKSQVLFNNIIRWKAPKEGPQAASYRIYTDKLLQHQLAEISAIGRKKLKYVDKDVNPCIAHEYFIVSVGEFGDVSAPKKAKIGVEKAHCRLFKQQQRHESASSESSSK